MSEPAKTPPSPVRDRLAALRRQAGAEGARRDGAAPGAAGDGRSVGGVDAGLARLRADLEQLAAVRSRAAGDRPTRTSDGALAALLGGQVLAQGLVGVEQRLPLPAAHGRWSIAANVTRHLQDVGLEGGSAALFLDTETTGLAGGTGTTAFLVGAARVDGDALLLRQYLLTRFCGEPALLAELARLGADIDGLITFNGKAFDLPLLATRYRLAGLADPFAGRPHADLLHPVRRAFGRCWPDCRLTTVEQRLLGFARARDLPSAEVPEAWLRWLREGRPDRLPAVIDHNRRDLLSLAALPPALAAAFAAPGEHGADVAAIARQRSGCLGPEAAYALLAAHEHRLDARGLLDLAALARRQGRRNQAVAIWRRLAARDQVDALVQLAKHAEHVEHDLPAALALTRHLIELAPRSEHHRRRYERLAAKSGTASARR